MLWATVIAAAFSVSSLVSSVGLIFLLLRSSWADSLVEFVLISPTHAALARFIAAVSATDLLALIQALVWLTAQEGPYHTCSGFFLFEGLE